jgi:hypothetical protein
MFSGVVWDHPEIKPGARKYTPLRNFPHSPHFAMG